MSEAPVQQPQPQNGDGLKAVDPQLVAALMGYTMTDPECSDLMRAYIRSLIGQGNNDQEEIRKSLETGLRSSAMYDLGIGDHLRAHLGGYALSKDLFLGGQKPSEQQATNGYCSTASTTRSSENQNHWSNDVNQQFGGSSANDEQVVKIESNRTPTLTPEQQKRVDEVVRIMKQNIGMVPKWLIPSTLPSVAAHSRPFLRPATPTKRWSNVQNKTTPQTAPATTSATTSTTLHPNIPPDVARDLNSMEFEFDPASGLVIIKPPPGASKEQTAALRLARDGITIQSIETKIGSKTSATQPSISGHTLSGKAFGKQLKNTMPETTVIMDTLVPPGKGLAVQQSIAGYGRLPRLRVMPKQPASGGAIWSLYKNLMKTNPSAAADLLKLVEIKLQDFLHKTPAGKRALRGILDTTTVGSDHINPLPEPRNTPDWTQDSWYRGARQPPLGVRLEHILNFLRDEDVDRCVHFDSKYKEVGYYLNWLWEMDELEQLQKASPATKRLFHDAVSKLLVHKNFEGHHYTPSELPNGPPPTVPQLSTRLDWTNASKSLVLPNTEGIEPLNNRKAYNRRVFPRPSEAVNSMLDEETAGIKIPKDRDIRQKEVFETFANEAEEFWSALPRVQLAGHIDDQDTNLAVIEARAYNRFVTVAPAWILGHKRDRTGVRLLPDDTLILQDHRESWARERGARRAGMNQLLQSFHSVEQVLAGPQRSLVTLPLPPEVELKLKEKANGLQWRPPHLPVSKLPPQLETMPYTYWWNIYSQELGWLRYEAMLECQRKYGKGRRWVNLPKNLIWGGPFVWRQVDPDVQAQQDILKKAETTAKMLQLASTRAPRDLLTAVMTYVNRGLTGEFSDGQPPPELKLRDDEWYTSGEVAQARFVSGQDIKWLQYLTTDCASVNNCKGHSDEYTGADHQLYRAFAKRVKKLLADRSAYSLFRDYAIGVKVEQLLERMNAGAEGQVKKLTFKPYQACFFLDRMAEQGIVRFKPDLEWYGVVHRPKIDLAPEHRVRWPNNRSYSKVQIPLFPGDLVTYASMVDRFLVLRDENGNSLVKDGQPAPRSEERVMFAPSTEGDSQLYGFFANLGFRLGWTMWQLTHEKARWAAPNLLPVPTQSLRDAVKHFDDLALKTGQGTGDLPRQTRSRESLITKVQEVVQRANAFDWNDKLTEPEALQIIRDRIATEGEANLNLLAPARRKEYYQDGEMKVTYVHDISWDWAGVEVRGWRRSFWDMDRWAPHDDFLTAKSKESRAKDGIVDWAQCHDPFSCDKTPQKWKRPKLRRFGEEGNTRFKPGPAIYPIGDTKAQREAVEDYVTDLAARAMGINRHKRTWSDSFARLNPFSGPFSSPPSKPAAKRDGDAWLPKVDRKSLPVSFDPEGFLEDLEWNREQENAARQQVQGHGPDEVDTPETPAAAYMTPARSGRSVPVARRNEQLDPSDDDESESSTGELGIEEVEAEEENTRPAKRLRVESGASIMTRRTGTI